MSHAHSHIVAVHLMEEEETRNDYQNVVKVHSTSTIDGEMAIFFICRNNLADLKKKRKYYIINNETEDRAKKKSERNSNRRSRSDTQINNKAKERRKKMLREQGRSGKNVWTQKRGRRKEKKEKKWLNDKYFRLGSRQEENNSGKKYEK